MAEDKFDVIGPMFNAVGGEVARIVGGDPEGALLYVEIEQGTANISVFKDEGAAIRYFDLSDGSLFDLLLDAWYAEDADKRWATLVYRVHDGQFSADFQFPDQVDVRDMDHLDERREAVIRRNFGDKPVLYPPLGDGAFELEP